MPVKVTITRDIRAIHDAAKNAAMEDNRLEALAYANAKRMFGANANKLIEEFENNRFSQELAAGNEAESSILTDGGSLYSYIGIRYPYKPIEEMVKYLRENLRLPENRNEVKIEKRKTKTGIQIKFTTQIISKEDLYSVGSHEDGTSEWGQRNWLYVVMNPPKNYRNYFYSSDKFVNKSYSRSKKAIQSKGVVRVGTIGFFAPKDYLIDMMKKFKSKITA